jgi:hypothetical protein
MATPLCSDVRTRGRRALGRVRWDVLSIDRVLVLFWSCSGPHLGAMASFGRAGQSRREQASLAAGDPKAQPAMSSLWIRYEEASGNLTTCC